MTTVQCSVSHLIWSFLSARSPYPSNHKQRGQANELLFRSANIRQCISAINQQIQSNYNAPRCICSTCIHCSPLQPNYAPTLLRATRGAPVPPDGHVALLRPQPHTRPPHAACSRSNTGCDRGQETNDNARGATVAPHPTAQHGVGARPLALTPSGAQPRPVPG